jgi:hypothetical protein
VTDIRIVTDGLRKHAGRVEGVSQELDVARSAAAQVSMQGEAYGVLCSPVLVPILGALEAAGIAAISAAAVAVDATAMALRTTASGLDAADGLSRNLAQRAEEGLR